MFKKSLLIESTLFRISLFWIQALYIFMHKRQNRRLHVCVCEMFRVAMWRMQCEMQDTRQIRRSFEQVNRQQIQIYQEMRQRVWGLGRSNLFVSVLESLFSQSSTHIPASEQCVFGRVFQCLSFAPNLLKLSYKQCCGPGSGSGRYVINWPPGSGSGSLLFYQRDDKKKSRSQYL